MNTGPQQVSSEGDVVYTLPPNFRSALRTRSLLLGLRPGLAKAQATAAYLGRAAFGVALIGSVAVMAVGQPSRFVA